MSDTNDNIRCVRPMCHEFDANIRYNEDGLKPFFAADSRIKAGDGKQESHFSVDGEIWDVKLYFQDSGIEHPGDETPGGTPFDMQTMREFRLSVEAADDPGGQRSFTAHLAPRWKGMKSQSGKDISPPEGFGDGINVRVQGSNINFYDYENLMQRAFDSVGINDWYFYDPEGSTISDASREVRILKSRSGPIHSRQGSIAGLSHLLENDRSGYRKLVQNDSDEKNRQLPGYYHTATLGQARVQECFPDHQIPKEVKHYYAREALSFPKKHHMHHPKLCVSYQVNRWDESLSLDDLGQLYDELDQTLHTVLDDSGLPIANNGGSGPFKKGEYFDAVDVEYPQDHIYVLDLTEIRHEQESIVIRNLADGGFSPVEWDSLQTLIADGGEVSPLDIAEQNDRHVDSVRRALSRIDDMVDREYGRVSLRSNHIAEMVHDAVKEAKQSTRRAVEAGAKAIQASRRDLDEATSSLMAWAANWDVDLTENDYVEIDFGKMDEDTTQEARKKIRRVLREGRDLWNDSGKKDSTYIGGEYKAVVQYEQYPDVDSLSRTLTKVISGGIGTRI